MEGPRITSQEGSDLQKSDRQTDFDFTIHKIEIIRGDKTKTTYPVYPVIPKEGEEKNDSSEIFMNLSLSESIFRGGITGV